ncbi:sensor histidine kinase, partial [Chloroflexus sp.]
TPEGGCITVRSELNNDNVQVIVEDTGIGITAEHLPFIFERFYRADPSRARTSGGSGIGLTIARHLAWAMGGDISAASAGIGKGSTFTLTLPRVG